MWECPKGAHGAAESEALRRGALWQGGGRAQAEGAKHRRAAAGVKRRGRPQAMQAEPLRPSTWPDTQAREGCFGRAMRAGAQKRPKRTAARVTHAVCAARGMQREHRFELPRVSSAM